MKRFDALSVLKVERTPQGGLKIQGALTRTGIFTYRNADGTERKEYRPPEEVFSAAHLDSFKGAPVTVGHPGLLTPDNWKDHAVGHIGDDVRQDGQFAVGTLYVQDAKAVAQIEKSGPGQLKELSCGYDVDLEETPGVTANGERYDAVQHNIRGNHVAMGPVGWGRAGRDVAMRLDSVGDEQCTKFDYTENDMPELEKPEVEPTKIKAKSIDIHVDGQAEIDRLTASNEMLTAQNAELKAQLADTSRVDSLVAERVSLIDTAKSVVKDFKAEGKTNRQIKEEVITVKNPKMKFDSKTDDFVQAAFEMALTFETPTAPHSSLGQVRVDSNTATVKADSIKEADERNRAASRDAWKQPAAVGQK